MSPGLDVVRPVLDAFERRARARSEFASERCAVRRTRAPRCASPSRARGVEGWMSRHGSGGDRHVWANSVARAHPRDRARREISRSFRRGCTRVRVVATAYCSLLWAMSVGIRPFVWLKKKEWEWERARSRSRWS